MLTAQRLKTIAAKKITAQCLRSVDGEDGSIFDADEIIELPNGVLLFPTRSDEFGGVAVNALFLEGRDHYMPGDETVFSEGEEIDYPVDTLLVDIATARPKQKIKSKLAELLS